MKQTRRLFYVTAALLAGTFIVSGLSSQKLQAADKLNVNEVRQIVKDYLKDHPEIVIEAMEDYQKNLASIEAKKFKDTIAEKGESLTGPDLPFAGNPDGDITIIEFFDYNCGYCKRATNEIQKLLERDDKIKVVFHEMPILRSSSNDAARYAMAAHKQGKYWEYHLALMQHSGGKSVTELERMAKDVGLDVDQLRKDADSKDVRGTIEDSLELSRELGIRGTPAFIIGDEMVPGYMTASDMQNLIKKVRDGKG